VRVSWNLTAAAVIMAFSTVVVRAETPPNTLSEAERRAGWRLLFDGRTTDGFRGYRGDAMSPGWIVEDGALVLRGAPAGDLVTSDEFGSFELQLDYRIGPGGNSGLMFHVTEEGEKPWHSGPEVQILDNVAGKDPQRSGWLYQLYAPRSPGWNRTLEKQSERGLDEKIDATRPAGEWNHLTLRVTPSSGEVCVNGVHYYHFRKGSKDWNERVARSKFAAYPSFGKADRGHLCLQDHGDEVAFRSIKIRTLPPDGPLVWQEDGTLPVVAVPAFPGMAWEGWEPEGEDGRPALPLRPLLVTHANDGTGRVFVPDQQGMIHVIRPGDQTARLFLDLRDTTAPWTGWNEEGLLGLAFHPRFQENGQFFVCRSIRGAGRIEQVARYRVSRDDPDRADPDSEEVLLLSVEQPFWNHNGGSITFGPDGHLYVGLGDGGSRDDPHGHGQRLDVLFGKILRLDVDRRAEALPYAIPDDNPFVGRDGARPEIYAYGFRNPWQISCDRKTGRLWAADVGQDLWEEIDIVVRGGNYGWSVAEGTHPFGATVGHGATIDPVWEYDHQIGKSVIGGFVYRGAAIPELVGRYVHSDFVSGQLWALQVDADDRPVANARIPWNGLPIYGFGEDADGELYVCTASPAGQGIFRLAPDADPSH